MSDVISRVLLEGKSLLCCVMGLKHSLGWSMTSLAQNTHTHVPLTHIHVHTLYICTHTCAHTVHTRTHTCTHTVHMYTYMCTYMYIHVRTVHTHMHTHTYIQSWVYISVHWTEQVRNHMTSSVQMPHDIFCPDASWHLLPRYLGWHEQLLIINGGAVPRKSGIAFLYLNISHYYKDYLNISHYYKDYLNISHYYKAFWHATSQYTLAILPHISFLTPPFSAPHRSLGYFNFYRYISVLPLLP